MMDRTHVDAHPQARKHCGRCKHVGTLMRRMGIEALYRKPNTSRKQAAHKI
jgi:hypothetical protein